MSGVAVFFPAAAGVILTLVFAVVTLVKSKRDCTQPVNAKVIAFDDFVE